MKAVLFCAAWIVFFLLITSLGEKIYTIAERDSGIEAAGIILQFIGRLASIVFTIGLIIATCAMEVK